jgi:CHASE2 domain-containing sensor protein
LKIWPERWNIGVMKRFLIFTALFPPLALAVFTAPDAFAKNSLLDWWGLGAAYMLAIIPAWLIAGVDWALSAKPAYLRIAGTAVTAAMMTSSIALFLWGFFPGSWPALMAGLVGAVPAAMCSWLSGAQLRQN